MLNFQPKTTPEAMTTVKPFRNVHTLTLSINATYYQVEVLDVVPEIGTRAYRLAKHQADGATYDVVQTPDGHAECDCPDFECRRKGLDPSGCKHVKALRRFNLIAPMPAPAPERDATVADLKRALAERRDEPAPEKALRNAQAAAFGIRLPSPAPAACCDPAETSPCAACVPAGESPAPTPAPAPLPPEDGEGQGAPGEDRGPADPADEWDGLDDLLGGDDEADPIAWPAWTDDFRFELGPKSVPAATPATLSLDEWIDHEADRYRGLGTDAGLIVADQLATLARTVRFLGCRTPGEYERYEALDRLARREEHEADQDASEGR